ncbi:MAG: trypsin-like peptidase domain-containing protein [Acidimicrobiia bacterium]|jgi:S1-C subfamily serine protease|nr:trypsin-like peptidase domain-containing protein [Acidimicrobiia bacterium]
MSYQPEGPRSYGAERAAGSDDRPGILPRSVLGLAAVVLSMGLASAFTGAVLYAYYEARLEENERNIEAFVDGFADQLEAARGIVQEEGERAREEVEAALDEFGGFTSGGTTLTAAAEQVGPSMFSVATLDETGAPSVGSAFVAFSDPQQSFLLTSFATVRAATAQPAPVINVRQGTGPERGAQLINWDPGRDLALLVVDIGSLPPLPFVAGEGQAAPGDRLFAVSGFGANGAAIVQGSVADVAAGIIQHDAPIGAHYQGGPLLTTGGEVLGVSSRSFAPLGFAPLAVFFAPNIRTACDGVLSCPDGNLSPGAPPG